MRNQNNQQNHGEAELFISFLRDLVMLHQSYNFSFRTSLSDIKFQAFNEFVLSSGVSLRLDEFLRSSPPSQLISFLSDLHNCMNPLVCTQGMSWWKKWRRVGCSGWCIAASGVEFLRSRGRGLRVLKIRGEALQRVCPKTGRSLHSGSPIIPLEIFLVG